jgi:ketosteroid isomerase-like protein
MISAWAFPAQAHSGLPRAQKHESRHEIDQLEDQWHNAMLKGDTAAMDSLLADDFMAITASGTLETKEQMLASLRSGRLHFSALNISDRKVRFYGTTALVISIVEVEGCGPDGPFSGNFRYTRVYARNPQGAWKIVNFEASRIREPGERR